VAIATPAFMNAACTLRRCLIGLGAMILLPIVAHAHQISLIQADAVVHSNKLELTVHVLPEDVLLSAGTFKIVTGRIATADIQKGVQTHPKLFLDGLVILDENGHRLNGKVTGVDLPPMAGDSVLADDLLATTIVYRVEFPLTKPPSRLSFQHHFTQQAFAMPVMAQMTITREGLAAGTTMEIPGGDNPETVVFDWSEAGGLSVSGASSGGAAKLPAYDVTDVYIYIQNEEVRVEILMPLSTLETWLPIKRANPDFLEPIEQVKPRIALAEFFTGQNKLQIDGLLVKPRLERYDFYGIDYRDFSVRPAMKRVSAASARIGAILTYSTKGAPHHMDLTWTLFNPKELAIRAVVCAYDKASRLSFEPDKATFTWDNPGEPPLPKIEAVAFQKGAIGDNTSATLSQTLLRNVYRGFDYREETDIYEALARSVQGELLGDLYLKIKEGLTLQEQGGAVARVKDVTVVKSEPAATQLKDGFVERVTWRVEGTVEHWGHIHTRVNEYTADIGIGPSQGAWKINSLDVVKQTQVSSAVSLRRL